MRGRSTLTVSTVGADATAVAGEAQRLDFLAHAIAGRFDDERPGRELDVADLEGRLRALHRHVLQAIAQRDQVQRAVVLDDRDRTGAGDRARRSSTSAVSSVAAASRIDLSSIVLTSMLFAIAHRPRAVVVGGERGIGIGLLLEQRLGQRPVRLIQLDDVGAGGEGAFLDLDLRRWRDALRWPAGEAGSPRDRPASDRAGRRESRTRAAACRRRASPRSTTCGSSSRRPSAGTSTSARARSAGRSARS